MRKLANYAIGCDLWSIMRDRAGRKYIFGGAMQYFAGQRHILTKTQNAGNFQMLFATSLVDSEKSLNLERIL